jgi:tRNA(Arg) A34 adenosine deaminase TadA
MPRKKHVVSAIVYDKKGRRIAGAVNNYRKSHPIQAHFASLAGSKERIYLHAEIAALLRCGTHIPHTLVVNRLNAKGESVCAKPCEVCSLAIKHWKIARVVHS